ncbi:hypothetical protein AB0J38_30900 [Streptomyces sp. NPDC050095]|uniref:hypothetical protein n=1 Tax=unclassified Streptomyces TaxID=2593676 RepID=UPI0034369CF4
MLTFRGVLPQLLRPELHAARTLPLLWGALCSMLTSSVPLLAGAHPDTEASAILLRACAVFSVIGIAFLLDDPAAISTAVTPVSRRVRHAVRLGAGLVIPAVAWASSAALVRAAMPDNRALPVAALALEGVVLALLTVLLTLLGLRFTTGVTGSLLAAPALVIALAVMLALPAGTALFVSPTDADWHDAVVRWRILGAGTLVGCLWLLRSEPGSRMSRRTATSAVPEATPRSRVRA